MSGDACIARFARFAMPIARLYATDIAHYVICEGTTTKPKSNFKVVDIIYS